MRKWALIGDFLMADGECVFRLEGSRSDGVENVYDKMRRDRALRQFITDALNAAVQINEDHAEDAARYVRS